MLLPGRRLLARLVLAALVALAPSFGLAQTRSNGPPGLLQANLAVPSATARLLPVIARHGAVSSQEALATKVGVDILKRGGNAVDAAVAVGFTLAVTLPAAGNLGGGGFMLVHIAKTGETIAIDYREAAPMAATRDMFLGANGEPDPAKSRDSGLGIGVPGSVAGLALAEARYGSGKFTLAELIAPAIALARDGIPVEGGLADSLERDSRLGKFGPSRAVFFADDKPIARGGTLVQADLARTLEAIARSGPDAFYRGPIADRIVAAVKAAGGIMTSDDLAAYHPIIRKPVTGTYRGYDIVSMPPPSSGGVHLVEILNILEGFDLAKLGAGSADQIHLLAEAMKPAYADRARYLGDPDRVAVPVAGLTSKAYAATLRAGIDSNRARPAEDIAAGNPLPYESDQTTHFSVVDQDGNAVANTYTLNYFFGIGLIADGTGVLLNNELDDFAAKTGAQNTFGLVGGEMNSVAPGARPLSSMSPTIVFKDGKLVLVTGSIGGSRIITHTLQAIVNVVDNNMNIAEAITAPRIHHQWKPDVLSVETGLSPDTLRLLAAKGHRIVVGNASGSTNSIMVFPDHLEAAADPRYRDTLAAGY
ncbi:MAG: gamma-glutamyltransferase [Ancalomicrobiaceae bacterium]|nr:gamma-glutamyltransferase [Ancalomicrobiaceae bacterium]